METCFCCYEVRGCRGPRALQALRPCAPSAAAAGLQVRVVYFSASPHRLPLIDPSDFAQRQFNVLQPPHNAVDELKRHVSQRALIRRDDANGKRIDIRIVALAFVDAVDRTALHAGAVLDVDAWRRDHISH
ncbi:hypothetical protein BN2475_120070 [Paraburkholderia ribeironis]|uniref:Uncharacterized protein n=1 Tax=Paraburkholderia ribeironis TaxID=1247936 RepID=A0A1N7RS76_9BURK|nr:hypothetical protein BN2475_120070 [Paraburkholderia ribeironis]